MNIRWLQSMALKLTWSFVPTVCFQSCLFLDFLYGHCTCRIRETCIHTYIYENRTRMSKNLAPFWKESHRLCLTECICPHITLLNKLLETGKRKAAQIPALCKSVQSLISCLTGAGNWAGLAAEKFVCRVLLLGSRQLKSLLLPADWRFQPFQWGF